VPQPDGTIQPISDPELNTEDRHLSKALDELARLADAPVQKYVSLTSSVGEATENESDDQIPRPLLEPIPIEVPLPPTPVIVQPPMNAVLASSSENGGSNQENLLAELATLSAATSDSESLRADTVPERFIRRSDRNAFPLWMFALIAVGIFLAGMLTERIVRVLERPRPTESSPKERVKAQVIDHEMTGRITYKTKQGESHPDRGARILVFPENKLGEVKLSVVGFRPADSTNDQAIAGAALKAMGGGAVTADDTGSYHLPVEAGSYRILVLSHFQSRDDSVNDPVLFKLLSEYFEKPEELLGRMRYQFATVRIKGTGDIWDHSF
jgi:hypothetical protein